MSPEIIGVIALVIFFILIFIGMPIAFVFIGVGFLGLSLLRGFQGALSFLALSPYATMTTYIWAVFPLFVFMGYLAQYTGVAEDFYEGARRWLGHFPGGLAHTVVMGNTAFGACVGDPGSANVTFAAMSVPEMRKNKYADTLTLGSILGAGVLATLIPPSGTLIIYGAITITSIGSLFIAGIVPGLLLTVLYMVLIYIMCRINPKLGPASPKATWGDRWIGTLKMWPFVVVILGIMGSIFFGIVTPTEAGAGGAFIMLVLGLARKRLSWQRFRDACTECGKTVAMVAFLIIGALLFCSFLAYSGLTQALATGILEITDSPTGIILIILAVYIMLGMFMDPISIVLLSVPIFYPLVTQAGFDSLQFGILVTIMVGMGGLTPPYGVMCIVMGGLFKDVPLPKIYLGAAPFLISLLVCALLVIFIPSLATWLPSMMIQR